MFKFGANFNNYPMVIVIFFSKICRPTFSLISNVVVVGNTSRCSIANGRLAHYVDQNGLGVID
jgi:hypothetical protein